MEGKAGAGSSSLRRKRRGKRMSKAERLARRGKRLSATQDVDDQAASSQPQDAKASELDPKMLGTISQLVLAHSVDEAERKAMEADRGQAFPSATVAFLKLLCHSVFKDSPNDSPGLRPSTVVHFAHRLSTRLLADGGPPALNAVGTEILVDMVQARQYEGSAVVAEALGPELASRFSALTLALMAMRDASELGEVESKVALEDRPAIDSPYRVLYSQSGKRSSKQQKGRAHDRRAGHDGHGGGDEWEGEEEGAEEGEVEMDKQRQKAEATVRRMLSRDGSIHHHLRLELLRHIVSTHQYKRLLWPCLPCLREDSQAMPSTTSLSLVQASHTPGQPPASLPPMTEEVRGAVERAVRKWNPTARVECFGSACLEDRDDHSVDLDLCILCLPPPSGVEERSEGKGDVSFSQQAITDLAIHLGKKAEIDHIWSVDSSQAKPNARVPVLALSIGATAISFRPTARRQHLQVDLVVNNAPGLVNTELQRQAMAGSEAVRLLWGVVREWITSRRIKGVDRGYLSTYSWRLLVIAFCQRHGWAPYFPAIQALAAAVRASSSALDTSAKAIIQQAIHPAPSLTSPVTTTTTHHATSTGEGKRSREGESATCGGQRATKRLKSGHGEQADKGKGLPSPGELWHKFLVWLACGIDHRHQEVICLHRVNDLAEASALLPPRGLHSWPRFRLADPVEPGRDLASHCSRASFTKMIQEAASACIKLRDCLGFEEICRLPWAPARNAVARGSEDGQRGTKKAQGEEPAAQEPVT